MGAAGLPARVVRTPIGTADAKATVAALLDAPDRPAAVVAVTSAADAIATKPTICRRRGPGGPDPAFFIVAAADNSQSPANNHDQRATLRIRQQQRPRVASREMSRTGSLRLEGPARPKKS